MTNYDNQLYARGFLFTTSPKNELLRQDWKYIQKVGMNIYFHPLTQYGIAEEEGDWLFLIGQCIDVINKTVDLKQISKTLYEYYNDSEEKFYNYLERLSGRFAIVLNIKGKIKIYNDATGMQSVFYHSKKVALGSHALLVAEATKSSESSIIDTEWLKDKKTYHLPGDFTPYEDIFFLLPNHTREMNSAVTSRYFPREDLTQKNIDEVIAIVEKEANEQLNLISDKYNILMSLTAGLDSRSTLALLKNHLDKVKFFTYYYMHSENSDFAGSKSLLMDEKMVKEMVDNLNLNHQMLPIDYARTKDDDYLKLRNILSKNTFLNHNSLLAKLYFENFPPQENILHLRSNIQEITRMFYRKMHRFNDDIASFGQIAKSWSPNLWEDPSTQEPLKKWLDQYTPNVGFGYDPFDILYWESRMGTWHSQLLIQSDLAFNTHILINSHFILKNMLAVSTSERRNNLHLTKLIEKRWPVLSFWKVNEDKNLLQIVEEQQKIINAVNSGIKVAEITYSGGNINGDVKIPVKNYVEKGKEVFYISKNAPEKGDYAQAVIEINKNNNENMICLEVCSPYYKPKNSGRMVYQIYLNDNELLLEEDVALWGQTNQICMSLPVDQDSAKIMVRVMAIKDCEKWNWGKAGRIQIEKVSLFENHNLTEYLYFSSPFSNTKNNR
ncbi:hypothetical protein ERJ70_16715 [Sediminibacillus dalangtanensis]|uniref:Asparagine synthase (Glutamine-hydrolysing) n=1 Tax=Sediminibacillus dalangtanensis TaxID=2729421 RepID=A0ABX7VUY7_9BACI|nr:hypothetical protein [Sediminibacillus dalangtanensis]QTN00777.1 hypothetical protein ERJ70_16715 [Sediminibacillus dalangtanensis]